MRVEFVGAPGAGKSTVFARAVAEPSARDRADTILDGLRANSTDRIVGALARWLPRRLVRQRAYQLFYRSAEYPLAVFRFQAQHPEFSSQLEDLFARCIRTHDKAAWRIRHKVGTVQALHQFTADVEVPAGSSRYLDEEFVQALLLTLSIWPPDDATDLVRSYLDSAPIPDVVVAIDTPANECAERLRGRGGWPTLLSPRTGHETLDRFVDLLPGVLAELTRRHIEVVVIDGSATRSDRVLADVRLALERRAHQHVCSTPLKGKSTEVQQ